jgi:hypothetical protein
MACLSTGIVSTFPRRCYVSVLSISLADVQSFPSSSRTNPLVAASFSSPGGKKLAVPHSVFTVPLCQGISAGLARSVAFLFYPSKLPERRVLYLFNVTYPRIHRFIVEVLESREISFPFRSFARKELFYFSFNITRPLHDYTWVVMFMSLPFSPSLL